MKTLPTVDRGDNEPLYNIGIVSKMTGISMATLRAWERRYNFPDSGRTIGGHRLYSEQDILSLKWVKQRVDDRMQTAQAINALRYHIQLGTHIDLDLNTLNQSEQNQSLPVSFFEVHQRQLYELIKLNNLNKADELFNELLAVMSPDNLILNIIGPVLAEIGEQWSRGKIGIAQEHLATNYLRQKLLYWMVGGSPVIIKYPVVLACAPDELHEGSLLILGALLRRRRIAVAYLGQSVPLLDLLKFSIDVASPLIVVAAMTEASAQNLTGWSQLCEDLNVSNTPVLCFGGKIFTESHEWQTKIDGFYLGDTFDSAINNIEKILKIQ